MNTPFESTQRLAELAQHQQQIENELDLTKNQAPAQHGPDPLEEPSVAEPDADSLKESYAGV